MRVAARTLKNSVDLLIKDLINFYKHTISTSQGLRQTLANFIKDYPDLWAEAFTADERTELTNLNATVEAIENYISTNLPKIPDR